MHVRNVNSCVTDLHMHVDQFKKQVKIFSECEDGNLATTLPTVVLSSLQDVPFFAVLGSFGRAIL